MINLTDRQSYPTAHDQSSTDDRLPDIQPYRPLTNHRVISNARTRRARCARSAEGTPERSWQRRSRVIAAVARSSRATMAASKRKSFSCQPQKMIFLNMISAHRVIKSSAIGSLQDQIPSLARAHAYGPRVMIFRQPTADVHHDQLTHSKVNSRNDHGNQLPPAVIDHGNIDQTQIFHERKGVYAGSNPPTTRHVRTFGHIRASTRVLASNTTLRTGICPERQETPGQK
jgi:hypothetical protein